MAIWGEFIFQFLRFEKFDYNSDNERIIGNLIAKEPSLCNHVKHPKHLEHQKNDNDNPPFVEYPNNAVTIFIKELGGKDMVGVECWSSPIRRDGFGEFLC